MANLVFAPIQDQIRSGSYLLYDGAIGTGGMLTIAEETLGKLARGARSRNKDTPLRPGSQSGDLRDLRARIASH